MQTVNSYLKNKKKKENTNGYKMKTPIHKRTI